MSNVEKRNSKVLLVVFIISAIILSTVIILALTGAFNVDRRTDEEKLVDAAIMTMLSDSKTISTMVQIENLEIEGLEGIEAQLLERVINDLELEITTQQESSTNTLSMAFSLGLNDISILEGEIFINEAVIAIHVPTLYDKVVYGYMGQMDAFLKNVLAIDLPEMPMMSEGQKAAHEEIFTDIEDKLVARDYEAIEQMDFLGYYNVITEFITSISVEEMMVVEEGETELRTYQLAADFTKLMSIFSDLMAVYEADTALQAIVDEHTEAMNNMEMCESDMPMDFKLDSSLNGLDEISLTSEINLNDQDLVDSSLLMVSFPIEGIPGILEYPLDATISIASDVEISDTPLVIEAPNLDGGVDITSLDAAEMELFLEDLMTQISENLSENQVFQMMGIDPGVLFGQ